MQAIIDQNLELMTTISSEPDGSFMGCVVNESAGGNAGRYKKRYLCVGANYHYDKNTGEVLYFMAGTSPERKLDEERGKGSIFRVAIQDIAIGLELLKFRIVGHKILEDSENLADKVLIATVKQYNERFGFEI